MPKFTVGGMGEGAGGYEVAEEKEEGVREGEGKQRRSVYPAACH